MSKGKTMASRFRIWTIWLQKNCKFFYKSKITLKKAWFHQNVFLGKVFTYCPPELISKKWTICKLNFGKFWCKKFHIFHAKFLKQFPVSCFWGFFLRMGFSYTINTLKTGLATHLKIIYKLCFNIIPQMTLMSCWWTQ